jgi:hypothetical protein
MPVQGREYALADTAAAAAGCPANTGQSRDQHGHPIPAILRAR